MIRKPFHQTQSFTEKIVGTTRELGKHYSKLELASHKLRRRGDELLGICKMSIKNGFKERALIYANEISEIRKFISVISSTQIGLERAILRLETYKEVCPTLKEVRTVYSDIKEVTKSLAEIMPNIYPEMESLNKIVEEILETTQLGSVSPIEPVIPMDLHTEKIIEEATQVIEEDIKSRIPEPPQSIPLENPRLNMPLHLGQKVALTTDGSQINIPIISERNSHHVDEEKLFDKITSGTVKQNSTSADLLLDYLYRKNGEIDVQECARDLNMDEDRIMAMLNELRLQRKIKIEQ